MNIGSLDPLGNSVGYEFGKVERAVDKQMKAAKEANFYNSMTPMTATHAKLFACTWTSKMAKIVDPILSVLGYWAIILGSFGGPGSRKQKSSLSCFFQDCGRGDADRSSIVIASDPTPQGSLGKRELGSPTRPPINDH